MIILIKINQVCCKLEDFLRCRRPFNDSSNPGLSKVYLNRLIFIIVFFGTAMYLNVYYTVLTRCTIHPDTLYCTVPQFLILLLCCPKNKLCRKQISNQLKSKSPKRITQKDHLNVWIRQWIVVAYLLHRTSNIKEHLEYPDGSKGPSAPVFLLCVHDLHSGDECPLFVIPQHYQCQSSST